MSATEIIAQFRKLPPEERREVVEQLRDELSDLDGKLSHEELELIDARLQEHRDHPNDVVSWEDAKAEFDAKRGILIFNSCLTARAAR